MSAQSTRRADRSNRRHRKPGQKPAGAPRSSSILPLLLGLAPILILLLWLLWRVWHANM